MFVWLVGWGFFGLEEASGRGVLTGLPGYSWEPFNVVVLVLNLFRIVSFKCVS